VIAIAMRLIAPRDLLVLALVGSAGAKLLAGPSIGTVLGQPVVHHMALATEILIAVLLCRESTLRYAAIMAMALFGGGVVIGIVSDVPCGCLGAGIHLTVEWHLLVSGMGGLLACWTMAGSRCRLVRKQPSEAV